MEDIGASKGRSAAAKYAESMRMAAEGPKKKKARTTGVDNDRKVVALVGRDTDNVGEEEDMDDGIDVLMSGGFRKNGMVEVQLQAKAIDVLLENTEVHFDEYDLLEQVGALEYKTDEITGLRKMLRRHPQLDFLEGPRRKKYKYGALAFIPKFRVHNIQALEALLKTMYEGKHENGSERGMKLDHLKQSYNGVLDDLKTLQDRKKAVIIPFTGSKKEKPGVKFDRYAGMLAEELDLNSVAFYRDAPLELKVDENLLEKWRDSSVQGKNEQEIKNTLEKNKQPLMKTERKEETNKKKRKRPGARKKR